MKRIAIVAAVAVVAAAGVAYNLSQEQARERGFIFGNDLQRIQDDLKALQEGFETQRIILAEGDTTEEEFIEYTGSYIEDLQRTLQRYEDLDTPAAFVSSVEFFRLSTEAQIQSAQEFLLWLESGDSSHRIRSDGLFQEAFEYELAALAHFNAAKGERNP